MFSYVRKQYFVRFPTLVPFHRLTSRYYFAIYLQGSRKRFQHQKGKIKQKVDEEYLVRITKRISIHQSNSNSQPEARKYHAEPS